jgi:hypothetical protein
VPRRKPLPPHCAEVGLVLQGGGTLGAYQAGVYATLAEGGYGPTGSRALPRRDQRSHHRLTFDITRDFDRPANGLYA